MEVAKGAGMETGKKKGEERKKGLHCDNQVLKYNAKSLLINNTHFNICRCINDNNLNTHLY